MNGCDIQATKSHCLRYRGRNRPTPFINSSSSCENTTRQPTHRIFIPKGSSFQSFTLKLSYPQQPPLFEELKSVKWNITCWELDGYLGENRKYFAEIEKGCQARWCTHLAGSELLPRAWQHPKHGTGRHSPSYRSCPPSSPSPRIPSRLSQQASISYR